MNRRRYHLLTSALAVLLLASCTGLVNDPEWNDDDGQDVPPATSGERQTAYKHGPPSGPAPWTYTISCYGGPSDSGAYNSSVACGGKRADGQWWYSTGAYSFGCFSKLELRANGKCAVVKVVDNGPAGWVEDKAKAKCGGTGYMLDVSPLVTKHLYGASCAGWSDCMAVQVRPVAANTPEGPCSGNAPPSPPSQPSQPSGNCHNDVPGGWGYCSSSCPCSAGQGDCDSDSECAAGLTCAHDVGTKYGLASTVDVCEAPAGSSGGSNWPSTPIPPTTSSWGSCSYNGQTGVCQSTSNSCAGGYQSGLCPGGNDIRCCLPAATNTQSSQYGSCAYNGLTGKCQQDNIKCWGHYITGLCPGGNNIRCCME